MTTKALTEEEELAILFPDPVEFKAGSLTIALLPMDTATCARFASKARPIIKAALAVQTTEFLGAAIVVAMEYPEEALAALAIATGKSEAFLGRLPPAVTGELVRKVFQINADFFAQSAALSGSGVSATSPDLARVGVGQTH